jgi:hypothetical protein
MLSVLLRDYQKDGPYVADTSSAAQSKEGMSSGNFSPLSLMIAGGGGANPLAFKLTPSSSLVVTISDNGSKGKAEIVKMESQVGMSEKRSAAVKAALVARGIGAARLATGGAGASAPKATNATLVGRAQNRRVELSRQ